MATGAAKLTLLQYGDIPWAIAANSYPTHPLSDKVRQKDSDHMVVKLVKLAVKVIFYALEEVRFFIWGDGIKAKILREIKEDIPRLNLYVDERRITSFINCYRLVRSQRHSDREALKVMTMLHPGLFREAIDRLSTLDGYPADVSIKNESKATIRYHRCDDTIHATVIFKVADIDRYKVTLDYKLRTEKCLISYDPLE